MVFFQLVNNVPVLAVKQQMVCVAALSCVQYNCVWFSVAALRVASLRVAALRVAAYNCV